MIEQRKRGRPRKASNAEIIENVMSTYWRVGSAEQSHNEICRKLEVAKPVIYRDFGGKNGLIAETLVLTGTFLAQYSLRLSKARNHSIRNLVTF